MLIPGLALATCCFRFENLVDLVRPLRDNDNGFRNLLLTLAAAALGSNCAPLLPGASTRNSLGTSGSFRFGCSSSWFSTPSGGSEESSMLPPTRRDTPRAAWTAGDGVCKRRRLRNATTVRRLHLTPMPPPHAARRRHARPAAKARLACVCVCVCVPRARAGGPHASLACTATNTAPCGCEGTAGAKTARPTSMRGA